jgi:hypothetical protein
MGRKAETILTFKVKIKLPTGVNTAQMQLHIRDAIAMHQSPLTPAADDFTVALMKKETSYA